jgi:hypothetical protein
LGILYFQGLKDISALGTEIFAVTALLTGVVFSSLVFRCIKQNLIFSSIFPQRVVIFTDVGPLLS